MRWVKWILITWLVLGTIVIGLIIWGANPAQPMPAALDALRSDTRVAVQNGDWLVFTPAAAEPRAGLIFYPGGRVDYRAYAPAARMIAQHGYLVVVPHMPLSLAVLGSETAEGIIETYPQVSRWAIGGHSLGGAMAARFAMKNPGQIRGLLLWAAYPPESDDLSKLNLKVTSVYGTNDGVAEPGEVKAAAPRLPADTRWVAIEGGNHAGFGWYGEQKGDGSAAISREAQQEKVVQAALDLLAEIEKE